MSETMDQFLWYSNQINHERKMCEELWHKYSLCRSNLDRLERERGQLFDTLMEEVELRVKRRTSA